MRFGKSLDTGSLIVIVITFVLFSLALVTKGFTHDLLLESGVFLVSVKLIILAHRSNVMKESLDKKLDAIHEAILKFEAVEKSTVP